MTTTSQIRLVPEDYYGPDFGGRQKNVTIVKPIVVGCRSKLLPEPIPNPYPPPPTSTSATSGPQQMHTHKWTIYLRSLNNEDMSLWIKKVQIKLHETYPNCLRTLTTVPFEVEETGWGEFEVQVKIFFVDPNERQITLWAFVKLFKKDPTDINSFFSKDGYLINEYYDELLFIEPTQMMLDMLNTKRPLPNFPKPDVDYDKKRQETIQNIRKARERVTPEIQAMTAKYEQFRLAYANVLAAMRGEPAPTSSNTRFAAESEYGGSIATSSQISSQDQQSNAD